MNVAAYVEALQQDLANVAGIGDEAVAEAARRIAAALESSLRLRLTDALGEAAAELTNQLSDGHVEVRISAGEPELVYVPDPGAPPPSSSKTSPRGSRCGCPRRSRRSSTQPPGSRRLGEHLAAPADHRSADPKRRTDPAAAA